MRPSTTPCEPALMQALRSRAGAPGVLTFGAFMDVALYHPQLGYYRKHRPRVGYGPGSDFLTAVASSPLFGRLVAAASTAILGEERAAGAAFVEIGAEPGRSILEDAPNPFRSVRTLRAGEPLEIEGPCVVFSNELLDAQPFRRFRFCSGAWLEIGVRLEEAALSEILWPASDVPFLPAQAPEGYQIDAPLGASRLAEAIARQPWTGLFLAFDYGKSWEELIRACPGGTARAYRRHEQGNDLLAHAGDQDLTCHVCWDWIAQTLRAEGFASPEVDSQEAFLVRYAGRTMAEVAASEAGRLSRDKLSLLNLLHPANLGQKFQVLWTARPPAKIGLA